MTIKLKRLPGLEGIPRIQGTCRFWCSQQRPDVNVQLFGPVCATPEEAAAARNAMIDRIIEECRK